MQEESQEERQILPHGRSKGDEHGWQQLVCNIAWAEWPCLATGTNATCCRIHKPKYMDEEKGSPKKDKKKARSKSRTRTMLGLKS